MQNYDYICDPNHADIQKSQSKKRVGLETLVGIILGGMAVAAGISGGEAIVNASAPTVDLPSNPAPPAAKVVRPKIRILVVEKSKRIRPVPKPKVSPTEVAIPTATLPSFANVTSSTPASSSTSNTSNATQVAGRETDDERSRRDD